MHTTLTTRRLGGTDMEITSVGFGAWAIGVTGAVVGARTPKQAHGWIDAGSIELNREDLEEIANIIEKTGAGSGPALPR